MAPRPCLIMRIGEILRASESDPRAQLPRGRNWVTTEIESAIGSRRLNRAETASVGAEEIDLGIVSAVVGPYGEIASGKRQVDAVSEVPSDAGPVHQITGTELAQLHERSVFDPVLKDSLSPRVP